MAPDTIDPQIRRLPIYQLGFNAGKDTGLRDALDCITAERLRIDAAATTRCTSYADAALARVQTAVANHFLHGGAS